MRLLPSDALSKAVPRPSTSLITLNAQRLPVLGTKQQLQQIQRRIRITSRCIPNSVPARCLTRRFDWSMMCTDWCGSKRAGFAREREIGGASIAAADRTVNPPDIIAVRPLQVQGRDT